MRLAPIAPGAMAPEMRREWEIVSAWRPPREGIVGGPYDAWLRSPELLHRLQGLGGFLWERTSLERGLLEYLIALTARHWQCNVEWRYHCERAREHGVDEATLAALAAGQPPGGPPAFRLAHRVASALLCGQSLAEGLYEAAREALGERGLVELGALVGYYSLVAFSLRLFDVEPEAGGPFPRPAEAELA